MRNKIWVAAVAGGLLVGAGLITSVVSLPGIADAQEETDRTRSEGSVPRGIGLLEEVLDELVGDGTIDQDQADAILAATEDKADEIRQQHQAERDQLQGMLEDGVITEEEAAELPDDHFLLSERFDQAWEDGELTREELQGLRHDHRGLFRDGFRLGSILDDGGIDEQELEQLPDDHPLKQADTDAYLDGDGLITKDELHEIFSGRGHANGEGA